MYGENGSAGAEYRECASPDRSTSTIIDRGDVALTESQGYFYTIRKAPDVVTRGSAGEVSASVVLFATAIPPRQHSKEKLRSYQTM